MVMSFSIFFTFARDAKRRAHVTAPDDGLKNGACGRAAAGETLRNGDHYWGDQSHLVYAVQEEHVPS
eukprot:2523778-Prymnesium_polylepis.1